MKKAVIASAMVATLSGCMQLADVESAPVSANVAASFPKDRLAKNTNEITVRAFLPGEKPNTLGQEVIGANINRTLHITHLAQRRHHDGHLYLCKGLYYGISIVLKLQEQYH